MSVSDVQVELVLLPKDVHQEGGAPMETLLAQVLDPIEIDVMQALWTRGPMTARELCATLPPARDRSNTTVRVTLRQLAERGVLRREPMGKTGHATDRYTPRLSRADVLAAALSKLCDDLGATRRGGLSVVQHTLAAVLPR
jgi:predicted transcriptional regulator